MLFLSFFLALSARAELSVQTAEGRLAVQLISNQTNSANQVGEHLIFKNDHELRQYLISVRKKPAIFLFEHEKNYLLMIENKSKRNSVYQIKAGFDIKDPEAFFQCDCLDLKTAIAPGTIHARKIRVSYRQKNLELKKNLVLTVVSEEVH